MEEEEVVADEDASVSINSYSVSEANEDEYVQMLIDRERTESESSRISIDDWIKCARSDAITCILKVSTQSIRFINHIHIHTYIYDSDIVF